MENTPADQYTTGFKIGFWALFALGVSYLSPTLFFMIGFIHSLTDSYDQNSLLFVGLSALVNLVLIGTLVWAGRGYFKRNQPPSRILLVLAIVFVGIPLLIFLGCTGFFMLA